MLLIIVQFLKHEVWRDTFVIKRFIHESEKKKFFFKNIINCTCKRKRNFKEEKNYLFIIIFFVL